MAWSSLFSLLPLGIDFAEGWQQRRQEVRMAEHEARVNSSKQGVALRQRKWILYTSFYMVAYPYITMFLPIESLRQHTLDSFAHIDDLPSVAMWSWLLVLGAIWGVGIKDIPSRLWKK